MIYQFWRIGVRYFKEDERSCDYVAKVMEDMKVKRRVKQRVKQLEDSTR